jgi:transcriptional regulator with XRE-family HTH domain
MMGRVDKEQLGEFLRNRRERLVPEDVGLAAGPRRRTTGLRREEVAVLAYISTEYYTRLEQARASRPSSEVCAAIARALRLDEAETAHLFVLAGSADDRHRLHRRDVRPSIVALVHRLPSTAAFVLSACYEVLAWNDLASSLMEDFAARTPGERNLARKAFLGPVASPVYGIREDAEFKLSVVAQLRATLARYPDDPDVAGLVADLLDGSAEFARLWQRHDVRPGEMLTKTFDHPDVGPVTLDCDSVVLPERDQHLVLYSAPIGSAAADALALLELVAPRTGGDAARQPRR